MISFSDLYQRYARDVYRFALYLSGDPALAQDITSETFMLCLNSPEPIRTETVKGYLLTIARNLYLKECRRRARATELSDAIASRSPDLELAAAQKERLGLVLRALQELPEVDRSALLLRADDGLSYQQIAAVLGLSLAAVKVKIHRARLKLAAIGA
jgi:RNA polymerase sigma-70 factor, ECF subfamily